MTKSKHFADYKSAYAVHMQRGFYPAINCAICGKPVAPVSRSQKTCGGTCSTKFARIAADRAAEKKRQKYLKAKQAAIKSGA